MMSSPMFSKRSVVSKRLGTTGLEQQTIGSTPRNVTDSFVKYGDFKSKRMHVRTI